MPLPHELLWTRAELGDMMPALARSSKLALKCAEMPPPAVGAPLGSWMETAAAHLGLETEPCAITIQDADGIHEMAPAVLETNDGFVAIVSASRGTLRVLARDFSVRPIPARLLVRELRLPAEAGERQNIATMFAACGVEADERAVETLAGEKLRDRRIATMWQLRTAPGAGLWRQLRESRLTGRLVRLIFAHAIEYVLWIAAWCVIGAGVLEGRIDRGWLMAWILLLISIVPFRLIAAWNSGALAIGFGGLLRQRLLAGTLQLDPTEVRTQGAGRLLGRTIESEAVESLAVSGGIGSMLALVELAVVSVLMVQGAGGWLSMAMFAAYLGAVGSLSWRFHRRRCRWTEHRLALTHDLVEKMAGHRTRLVQQTAEQWHSGEDQALDEYVTSSINMDADLARLTSLLPRMWMIVGFASLAPAFVHSAPAASMAISIGAILLAYRGMQRLAGGALQLSGAWIAWKEISQIYHAAARREDPAAFANPGRSGTILEARDISFAHPGRTEVLSHVNCAVRDGDWILLEGASGGGKSTLASLFAGMREPSSGLLAAGGFDRGTLGSRAWRAVVAAAPQYHENHVFSGTVAFNLLMGRAWPPTYEDLEEAAAVCADLGLDDLLRRMPGGMNQMIGETGWQLSQGERSRLFLARALLQKSRLTILDETLAALDPENLCQALECALRRSNALMAVAHI